MRATLQMRKSFFRRPTLAKKPLARINERIKVPEVRVIDSKGQQIGILPIAEAIATAREQGMDLVEISPKAQPPVAKLVNFDKYRYQQDKLAQAQKKHQKKVEVKGIRLSVRIGQHDLEVKAKAANKFLTDKNKVKIEMRLRGRERANTQFALDQIKKFTELITVSYIMESIPKRMGGLITTILAPKV